MKPNNPLVSIAMCTYNGEKYLKEQLQSIYDQTYTNLEIIICDDGSSDNTINIIESFINTDKRIKLYKNETNLGYVKNFEKAISLCNGEYIALSDQDDIWNLKKIESYLQQIEDAIMIYCDPKIIDEYGKEIGKVLICNKKETLCKGDKCYYSFLLNQFISGNTMMFHKSIIEKILPIPKQIKFHDMWISMVAALQGKITYTKHSYTFYRKHVSQITYKKKSLLPNKRKEISLFLSTIISFNEIKDTNFLKIAYLITLLFNKSSISFSDKILLFWFLLRYNWLIFMDKRFNKRIRDIFKWIK